MEEQLQAQLLAQMSDIALPEPVSWWPLAIGWWVIGALILTILIALIHLQLKRLAENRYRALALTELNAQFSHWQAQDDDKVYITSANNLLKRVVRSFNPSLINQHSDAWVNALNTYSKTEFSQEARYALAKQCYQECVDADIPTLHNELSQWLKQHKREPNHA